MVDQEYVTSWEFGLSFALDVSGLISLITSEAKDKMYLIQTWKDKCHLMNSGSSGHPYMPSH